MHDDVNDVNKEVNKTIALLVINLSTFATAFMSSSINIALPSIGSEFRVDAILLGWVVTAYLLTTAMLLVPLGKAADIYGRKKSFIFGSAVFTLSSLLCSVAPSIAFLLGFRVLQGIGGAMLLGTGVAILSSVFPAGERGKALGINVGITYMGLSTAPALGGILTQHLGWKSIFLVNVPLGLLIIVLTLWKIKGEWAEAAGKKLDYAGSVIYGLGLIAMMYGLRLLPQLQGVWFIVLGLAGIVLFILWEMRIKNPILNMRLFTQNRVFALSNLAALLNYSATFALGFLLSLYLQYIKGLDPQNAGFVLVSQPAMMALVSPFAGRLSERIEPRILSSCGMAIIVVGLIPLSLISENTPLPFIIACLMVLGFGFAIFSSPNMNAIMSSVQKNYYSVASATLATMRLCGQLFSMATVMVIFAVNIGQAQITPEYHSMFIYSIKTAFTIFILLCCGGIFASLARGKLSDIVERPLHPPS
ncbi:MAG: MFS transporter [Bacillota bacterium]